ncbi:transposase [Anaerobacillus isosaccharinicus]|uniref:Transposase n=1 Tax=Anaerobacillus isosaccharinicus TaxID=1532552 RepID=A0A1S2ME69_9BACI|nr:transposase [Anaerobacillus isosaccharinicus]MBA5584633.1 transposase [Anaerobacillus isosaccharinicus]QOY36992.1 transposase [Anaerobacillus isosaccharinicus]
MVQKMPVWFPGAIYHVTCCCRWNETIFDEDADFITYLSLIESVRYQYPFYLHSYCLTRNHIHLLLETTHIPMKDVVETLNYEFLCYLQTKQVNFLPQVQANLIDSVDNFLIASKKIHLAPRKQNFPLKEYRWSSYQAFSSYTPNDHVVTSQVLTYFNQPKMDQYCRFVEAEVMEATNLWGDP